MSNKRERGSDSPVSNGSSHFPSASLNLDGTRPIAGRRNLGVPQAPSPSEVAGVGGLPYDTEHLARANPELIPGMQGQASMGLPWMHNSAGMGGQGGGSGAQQQLFGAGSAVSGASAGPNAMPSLNIFDLFQAEQQLFNVPMVGQETGLDGQGGVAYGAGGAGGRMPQEGGYAQQMDSAAMASMNEALQMWSSAPTSFE